MVQYALYVVVECMPYSCWQQLKQAGLVTSLSPMCALKMPKTAALCTTYQCARLYSCVLQ